MLGLDITTIVIAFATVCMGGIVKRVTGVFIGEKNRGWINQETFRKVMRGLLFLIGLNLIRRALFT